MAKILVIDDEAGLRTLLRDVLEADGHVIVEAQSGLAGLREFEHASFDIVLTDIIMPDREGIATIQDMLKARPDQKIIAMSGGGRTKMTEFLAIAETMGAARTLRKPFTQRALREAIAACLTGDRMPKP